MKFIEDYFKTDAEKISESIYGFKSNKRTNTFSSIIPIYLIALCFIVFVICFVSGCSTTRHLPPAENTQKETVIVRDSVIIRDSVVVIPKEKIINIVPEYDTLKLETSLARSVSYVDTTNHILRGSIENKKELQTKVRTEYITKETKDTVYISQSFPFEVEKIVNKVPNYYKILVSIWSALCFALGLFIARFK